MTLTTADIDEWLGLLNASLYSDGATYPTFFPYDWAREALGELLGAEVLWRRYEAKEMREMLTRARAVAILSTIVDTAGSRAWVQEALL